MVSLKGEEDTPREYMMSTGMIGSLYESTVWEEITGEESVSTISILAKASEEDIDILLISGANLETEIEKLNTDEATKQEVINAVNNGKVVTIPAENITMGDWHGTGYIVTNPETGAGAYMISGGLNGGEATAILTTEALVAIIAEIIGVYWFVSVFAATGFFITAPVMFAIAGLFILITLELVTFNMSASYFDYLESGDMDDYMNAEEKAGMLTLFGYMAVMAAQYLSYGTNVVENNEIEDEENKELLVVRDAKYLNADGDVDWDKWAPNGGRVVGSEQYNQTLEVGTVIDRYGDEFGRYTSPEGIPYEQRALPYIENPNAYHKYVVLKPINGVTISEIAEAFGQPGGGIQYELPSKVNVLINNGFLEEVK